MSVMGKMECGRDDNRTALQAFPLCLWVLAVATLVGMFFHHPLWWSVLRCPLALCSCTLLCVMASRGVVVVGLCFNLLVAVRFLSGSKKPQKTSDPKAARRVTLPVGRGFREEQNGRGAPPEREASICNFLDCCKAQRSDNTSGVLRHNSYAGGVDQPVWLQSDEHLHPKFCGYRLQEPGKMPSLDRFPPEELGSNVPSHWEYLLPGRCESERLKCRELRERVRHVEGAKDMVTMLRFLRARRGRVDDAAKMYEEAMRWRRQTGYELGFRMNTRNDWLHRKVDSCWPPTAMLGKDLDGDPVYWNRMGLGSMDFLEQVPTEFLIQHEVYTITRIMQALEEASRLSSRPVMYFTVVTDLGEMSLRNFNIKGIMKYKVCVRILEDHFPEIVKRIIAIRVPRIAYTLWNIASHFFDEGTRNKIQIADPQNTLTVLSQFMDPKWIPEALGGSHRIGESGWCEPCIPSPTGPPSEETMRALKSTYGDN
ncbi:retm [Symbiodinium microadriaticum]|nr:retm [Symbiodinium microadriaticum]